LTCGDSAANLTWTLRDEPLSIDCMVSQHTVTQDTVRQDSVRQHGAISKSAAPPAPLDPAALGGPYDTVIDSGLFHSFEDDDRSRLVQSLHAAIMPGGRYYMLCFTDQQPGAWGPRRVSQDEIRASFADGWRVDSIEAAGFEVAIGSGDALAWLSMITRT